MKKTIFLPLGNRQFAQVDSDCPAEILMQKWSANEKTPGRVYAFHSARGTSGKKHFALHRLVVGAARGEEVDHKNGDTLDNHRENLRRCSHAQNSRNLRKSRGGSKYKGVSRRSGGSWKSQITFEGKQFYLGTFDLETDAARAYDRKARELFGEFASTNFAA